MYLDIYKEKFKEIPRQIPKFFIYVFDHIQEAFDLHTLYEAFSVRTIEKVTEIAIKQATTKSTQTVTKEVTKAVQTATEAAINASKNIIKVKDESVATIKSISEDAAKKAEENAYRAKVKAEEAEKTANEAYDNAKNAATEAAEEATEAIIKNKIDEVTAKVSETSVTILGIFAGIVLAVVTGLFYFSSVLENINTANFYRLLCSSALVGFVCYNLLIAMFGFIIAISGKETSEDDKSDVTPPAPNKAVVHKVKIFNKATAKNSKAKFINTILLLIMAVELIGQIICPGTNNAEKTNNSNIDAIIDVNFSCNGSTSITTTEVPMTEETSDALVPETTTCDE